MKSIKTRLIVSFIIIILVTVVSMEAFLIQIIKQIFYANLEVNLRHEVNTSCEIYDKYFSYNSLNDNILNNVDTFWKQTAAKVQITDLAGNILMDSKGDIPKNALATQDIVDSIKGKQGLWIGKTGTENIMAVSAPLKSGGNIVGVLRYITSLRIVDEEVRDLAEVFIYIGIVVIAVSIVLCIIFARAVTKPLKQVTITAMEMAAGNYLIRNKKKHNDEVGKLSDTLNMMAQEILKKDELKNNFISSVSHELRTPLTAIKGWALTLKGGCINDAELLMDGLDIIEKESNRLTIMVEELLDFSKFISGKIKLKSEKVDINRLMCDLRNIILPRASKDGIDFQMVCDKSMPCITSDENRLKQIFINILDNAFNFTPAGGKVYFEASFTGKSIKFIIRDTGCGISANELPMVKEKFYKGKSSKSKNGIGLSICDEIIKMMNGAFEIKSEADIGTEVLITIPFQEVPN